MTPADALVFSAVQLLTQAAALGHAGALDALAALADPANEVPAIRVRKPAMTAAERSAAYRDRKRAERDGSSRNVTAENVTRHVTQRDASVPSQTLPSESLFSDLAEKTGESDSDQSNTREAQAVTAVTNVTSRRDENHVTPRDATKASRAAVTRDAVSSVYGYWLTVMGKDPKRSKLTSQRRTKIEARLREGYEVADLKAAIDGCKRSEFHMGGNDRGQPYNDLESIMLSGARVEQHIERSMPSGQGGVARAAVANGSAPPRSEAYRVLQPPPAGDR